MKQILLLCGGLALALISTRALGAEPPSQAEKAAEQVNTSARRLRIQIYESYRTERAEMERRTSELELAIATWQARGQKYEDSAALHQWLTSAQDRIVHGSRQPLPPPTFPPASGSRIRPQVPGRTQRPKVAVAVPAPVLAPQPQATSPTASAVRPQPAKIEIPRQSSVELTPYPAPLQQPPSPVEVARPDRATPKTQPPRPQEPPSAKQSLRRERLLTRTPFAPPGELALLDEELPPLKLAQSPPPFSGDEKLPSIRFSGELPPRTDAPKIAKPIALVPRLGIQIAQEQRRPNRITTPASVATQSLRPASTDKRTTLPTTQVSSGTEDVEINTEVLASKITRYNYLVRDLENELSDPNGWDLPRLRDAADAIQHAVDEKHHLELFHAALPLTRRSILDQISDPSIALAQFTQRMFEVRILYNEKSQQQAGVSPENWSGELDEIQQQVESWMHGQPD